MRRLLATAAATLCLLGPALAADGAKFRAVGFSADGQYFAFEQYGVQDGSGFPYDEMLVLDTKADNWAPGTPLRVLLEDETASVGKAHEQLVAKSQALLANLKITEPAEILAANPFTEVVADRMRIRFHNHFNFNQGILASPEGQGTFDLSITLLPMQDTQNCDGEPDLKGFKLELHNNKSNQSKILHEDTSLPKSRGCSLAYDIEAVVHGMDLNEHDKLVAIIGVSRRGFEGLDRRFIAVPFDWIE